MTSGGAGAQAPWGHMGNHMLGLRVAQAKFWESLTESCSEHVGESMLLFKLVKLGADFCALTKHWSARSLCTIASHVPQRGGYAYNYPTLHRLSDDSNYLLGED